MKNRDTISRAFTAPSVFPLLSGIEFRDGTSHYGMAFHDIAFFRGQRAPADQKGSPSAGHVIECFSYLILTTVSIS